MVDLWIAGQVGWRFGGLVEWWSGSLQLGARRVGKSLLARATAMGRRITVVIMKFIIALVLIIIIMVQIIMVILIIIITIIIRRPIAVARAGIDLQTSEPQAASFHSTNPPIHQATPAHQSNPSTSPPIHQPTSPLGPEVSEA